MEVAVPHFGRTAERLRLTTGRVSPWAQVRGGDQQGEGGDDDGDADVVVAVPAVHLLLPVGGPVVRGPRLAPVVDRNEQQKRHDHAEDQQRAGGDDEAGMNWSLERPLRPWT
jgi:hypothetical protein